MHPLLRTLASLALPAVLALAARAADHSLPGPHGGGWTTVTVSRPNLSTFTARLYYPATSSTSGAPFDAAGAPYPAVSFGHGFLTAPSAYHSTLQHLATWGYFVIASESQQSLFPSHQALADDLRYSLDWLQQRNADAGSPYFQCVDVAAFGLSGHSMGGGCSILAAAADPRVRALANLAAANTNPSSIAACASVACPLSLISGSADGIVPVASNGQLMYANARAPKLLPVIQGGWHCGFLDTPPAGGFGCDSGPLARAAQLALTRRLLVDFFELHLRGDQQGWSDVWGDGMRLDADVHTTFDAGVKLTPFAQRVWIDPGDDALFDVTVQNTSTSPQSYTLLCEGLPWPAALSATNTGPLAPGATFLFTVTVPVPLSAPPGLQRFALSARRDSDGATRGYARRGVRTN